MEENILFLLFLSSFFVNENKNRKKKCMELSSICSNKCDGDKVYMKKDSVCYQLGLSSFCLFVSNSFLCLFSSSNRTKNEILLKNIGGLKKNLRRLMTFIWLFFTLFAQSLSNHTLCQVEKKNAEPKSIQIIIVKTLFDEQCHKSLRVSKKALTG